MLVLEMITMVAILIQIMKITLMKIIRTLLIRMKIATINKLMIISKIISRGQRDWHLMERHLQFHSQFKFQRPLVQPSGDLEARKSPIHLSLVLLFFVVCFPVLLSFVLCWFVFALHLYSRSCEREKGGS